MNSLPRIDALLLAIGASILSLSANADAARCFLPRNETGRGSGFVEPKAKVCRAIESELNATCGGDIPMIEFKPAMVGSGVTEPIWLPISLYREDGSEVADSFALLEKLAVSRAMARYSQDREVRAKRDANRILRAVRDAHAMGELPRFSKTSLDLEGRGNPDVLYRLYAGHLHNPTTINDIAFKWEPHLFLERAIELAPRIDAGQLSPHAAGLDVVGMFADVILFDGTPYFLTWSSADTVLVYAAYLHRNRPMTPDEQAMNQGFVMPLLRCSFASRPNH